MRGDDRVPPDTIICLRALKILVFSWLGWRGFVGLVPELVQSSTEIWNQVSLHSLDGHGTAILDDDLVNLRVAREVEVIVNSPSRMHVGMGAIATTASLYACQ